MHLIKTILIIGANRGIGRELANRFQVRGYEVYGTYRPQTRDDSSVIELKKQGVHTFEVDLTDEQSINAAAVAYGERPLDVLVNVAGIYFDWDNKRFHEMTAEDFVSHFNINTLGPFLASKAFLPALSLSPLGKIINLPGNMAGIARNYGGNAPYRVSKTGLNQLTKTMAIDLRETGSNVVTLGVHPGWLPTKMTGFHGGDDMDTCMKGLVETIENLGTDKADGFGSGDYVKWTGEKLTY